MTPAEKPEFLALLASVFSMYRQDTSEFLVGLWWDGMRHYDLEAVRDAMGRHALNPDVGQWCPKPADIVKMLQGSTKDSSMLAWTKVVEAARAVGTYKSVCFDDPLCNAVLNDMGGWIALGAVTEHELPFRAKEFENRYRAYVVRPPAAWPTSLPGISERDNAARGLSVGVDLVLIGDRGKAKAALAGGTALPALTVVSRLHGASDVL